MIKINCSYCNKEFEQLLTYYNHNKIHRNNRNFCSKSCKLHFFRPITMIKVKCTGCGKEFEIKKGRYTSRHRENNGVHYCKKSCFHIHTSKLPFGYFMDKSKSSDRWKYDIDINFLTELWNKQKGMCPYTNIKMILPKSKKGFRKCRSIEKASLDRIDTSKGYLKGNVEFVCQGINFAKHDYSKEEVLQFVNKIRAST